MPCCRNGGFTAIIFQRKWHSWNGTVAEVLGQKKKGHCSANWLHVHSWTVKLMLTSQLNHNHHWVLQLFSGIPSTYPRVTCDQFGLFAWLSPGAGVCRSRGHSHVIIRLCPRPWHSLCWLLMGISHTFPQSDLLRGQLRASGALGMLSDWLGRRHGGAALESDARSPWPRGRIGSRRLLTTRCQTGMPSCTA